MVKSVNLGFPRIGSQRQLKKLIENFWNGKLDQKALHVGAQNLRLEHWQLQKEIGIELIPSNDFSFYDQVLDHILLFGCEPEKYKVIEDDLTRYFAMARGLQNEQHDLPAMEMKKWFDTNYHFIVPELKTGQKFKIAQQPKPLLEFQEAKAAGIITRPVLLGPLTFLWLSKTKQDPLSYLEALLPCYELLLKQLADAGVEWIQFDEPILSLDLDVNKMKPAFIDAYTRLSKVSSNLKFFVTNYFGRLDQNVDILSSLPVQAIHLDLVRAPEDLEIVLKNLPADKVLSLGLVNGRNIWKTDLKKQLAIVQSTVAKLGDTRVWVGPSCSLLHAPFSIEFEKKLNIEILNWMAFSKEKLKEIVILSRPEKFTKELELNQKAIEARKSSSLIRDAAVQEELKRIQPQDFKRQAPFNERYPLQLARLQLPLVPTTTIGSFPQTQEVRLARQKFKKGEWSESEYNQFIQQEIEKCIRLQEEIGLDVLVHGEYERNDMVEYFGESLKGYCFSENGWVQSYGSRCVKPPIIYGDVSRPKPMTVETSLYAQTLTKKPMKGMLTGPVTILQWSFVRDDQPRKDTTFQLALALRKEVLDLEKAGIKVIQIDEPAIREGLPLRRSEWENYLKWAVESFLLASCGVRNETQIHSHFCYSDFNDIFSSIAKLDADVITIENARSDLKLLEAFQKFKYQNAIGPGIYDIHSPRVPSVEEMEKRAGELVKFVKKELLWLNPDCGLKTRKEREVLLSLKNMVKVAQQLRK